MLIVLIVLFTMLIVVWVGFLSAITLTSRYELKKRAQSGDSVSKTIYGLTASGRQIYVAILFGILLATASVVLLFEDVMPSVFAALASTLVIGLFGILLPFLYGDRLGLRITAWLAPLAAKILTFARPFTRPIAERIDALIGKKSLLYSKDQLLRMLDTHSTSAYADISVDEMKLMRHSLEFGSKRISDCMIPRKVVSTVKSNDSVGPLLLDELHKSGHSRFPVLDELNPETIVGVLYLKSLLANKQKSGSVNELMSKQVYFVHEELDLQHALDAFIKTKHHLFVVVNSFEEYVGILTIEDVIEQILGRQIVDEFDNYENLREVASLRAAREKRQKQHI